MHRFVVVGGGAGGLELATRLGDAFGSRQRTPKATVTLIDRNPTHIWKPLLHEVAAGSMDPFTHQLEYAAQAYWHGFEFQQGALAGIDRAAHTVTIAAVDDETGREMLPARSIRYDTLVVAIGSTTHFFNVPGAEQHAFALDTVAEAERFRRRLIAACTRAQSAEDALREHGALPTHKRHRVQIAIVGGGATGVELSAELRNTAQVLSAYGLHGLDPREDIGIVLIESGPRLLPALPERVSTETARLLGDRAVELLLGERVTEIAEHAIRTASGRNIPVDLTVWAAGIKAPRILSELDGLTVNGLGQLNVKPTLQTELDDDIFALGDCAACAWADTGRNVPPRAQAAHQQAEFLFRAMRDRLAGKPLRTFEYRDLGSLVSLGHVTAVGNLMGGLIGGTMFIDGLFARVMYMSLYRMHIAALHGVPRMLLDTLAHWLRRRTVPRVKLH